MHNEEAGCLREEEADRPNVGGVLPSLVDDIIDEPHNRDAKDHKCEDKSTDQLSKGVVNQYQLLLLVDEHELRQVVSFDVVLVDLIVEEMPRDLFKLNHVTIAVLQIVDWGNCFPLVGLQSLALRGLHAERRRCVAGLGVSISSGLLLLKVLVAGEVHQGRVLYFKVGLHSTVIWSTNLTGYNKVVLVIFQVHFFVFVKEFRVLIVTTFKLNQLDGS